MIREWSHVNASGIRRESPRCGSLPMMNRVRCSIVMEEQHFVDDHKAKTQCDAAS